MLFSLSPSPSLFWFLLVFWLHNKPTKLSVLDNNVLLYALGKTKTHNLILFHCASKAAEFFSLEKNVL